MQSNLKRNRLSIFFVLLFILSGCATVYNPATQRNEFIIIDTKQEIALGQNIDRQLQEELKVISDPEMEFRLNSIGERIARASDRQDVLYRFRIVKDEELNAFSLPGGFVYVNSGLMKVANDDELAGVLAHEIGHIAAKHSVKKLQTALGYNILLSIAVGASGSVDLARATDIVFDLGTLGYGRNDEFLADKLSVKYSRRAGFSPYAIVTFFKKLKKESEKKGAKFQPVFLSSHPAIDERIKKIEEEIAATP